MLFRSYAGGFLCLAASVLEAMPETFPKSLIPSGIFAVTLLSIAVVAGYTKSIVAKFRRRQETVRHLAFARYAAMTLVPGASHQTVSRVMGLICEEFGLGFVAVEFDGGHGRIASVDLPDNLSLTTPSRPTERFSVKASDGGHVEVVFHHSREAGAVERHIVSACLARIFDGISMELLEEMAPRAREGELLPGITVLLPHRADSVPANRPGAAKVVKTVVAPDALSDEIRVEHTS